MLGSITALLLSFTPYEGVSLGYCQRTSPDVGAGGVCADIYYSADFRLSHSLLATLDAGFGFFSDRSSGTAEYGVAYSSGGPIYYVLRAMLGGMLSNEAPIFMRGGVQLRTTIAFDRLNPGLQGFIDLGTQLSRVELGVRGQFGFDGIASTRESWSAALSGGVGAFLRIWLG